MPIYILSYLPVSIQNSNLLMVIGGTDSNSRMMILLGPIFAKTKKQKECINKKDPKEGEKKSSWKPPPFKVIVPAQVLSKFHTVIPQSH